MKSSIVRVSVLYVLSHWYTDHAYTMIYLQIKSIYTLFSNKWSTYVFVQSYSCLFLKIKKSFTKTSSLGFNN